MYRVLLLLFLLLSGCTSTRTYNSLDFLPNNNDLRNFSSIAGMHSSVLSHFLTPRAEQAVSHIPVIDGLMIQPFVVGVNVWSSFGGIITFNGCSRKIVISKWYLSSRDSPGTILHEYIHQLDDLDRDGQGEWIDHTEFVTAIHRALQDKTYRQDILEHMISSDSWITNAFGIGPCSELIAYVGTWVARGNGPEYLRRVYRRILKNCQNNISSA